ncbi:MAG: hypothetical protein IKW19_09965 [Akkermansia sp.]|nr:hypothetical protein [Akkermansia sp.]
MTLNRTVELTGEAILLLANYIAYRADLMNDALKDEQPSAFTNRLRNRTTTILRATDDFAKIFDPMVKSLGRMDSYMAFSDIVQSSLDSFFEDLHRQEPEATLQVVRRAKLRYHDPYPTAVKECTAAFEDGYCKGFMDAMGDFMKTVEELGETHEKLTVGIINDKITFKPLDK